MVLQCSNEDNINVTLDQKRSLIDRDDLRSLLDDTIYEIFLFPEFYEVFGLMQEKTRNSYFNAAVYFD